MEELEILFNKYNSLRSHVNDALILIRYTDFYYSFGKDAELAHNLLDCAIAHDDELNIEFSAFHFIELDDHLPRLVRNGHRVALTDLGDLSQYRKDKHGQPILPNRYKAYPPSHCWYYHLNGPIVRPEFIKPSEGLTSCVFKFPKEVSKIEQIRDNVETELALDIEKYKQYASTFYNSSVLNLCTNLSLKHNHIAYNKAYLLYLNSRCPKQIKISF